jgi:hypothetical protein
MRFDGDSYETGTVILESVIIPVKLIFDMAYLLGMCVRRTALQYEKEVIEMQEWIRKKQHPLGTSKFKCIGVVNGKKNKKKSKNR